MSKYIHKSHNVTVILYHIVCPAKYRRVIFEQAVDKELTEICLEIGKRYEIKFIEIGTDRDHVHFLVQSVPNYAPSRVVQVIKSITAREVFCRRPEVKKKLWGGEFWSKGYFLSTVGLHGNEEAISHYVKEQGRTKEYRQLHRSQLDMGF